MSRTNSFEVEGVTFEVKRLPVEDACEGMDLLTADNGFRKFTALLKLFAPVTKVSRRPDGEFVTGGNMVDLKPFREDLFGGRLDLLVKFVEAATQAEYGGFLERAGMAPVAAEPPQPKA